MAKIEIVIWGYEHKTIDETSRQIIEIARSSGSQISGPIPLPTKREIFTVLRGVFRHKDSREQFERKIHKRLITIVPNSKTMDELKRIELPSSISLMIKTV